MKRIFLTLALIGFIVPIAQAAEYATWKGFEPDKCASIWLIKRFIDTGASFTFHKKNTHITTGIPFDVPQAKWRRYARMSTFEFILQDKKIKDPVLVEIGRRIHDMEINIWQAKRFEDTLRLQDTIETITKEAANRTELILDVCSFFDRLYQLYSSNFKQEATR